MTTFKDAVTSTVTPARTANNALTNASTLNANVDLFWLIGASRGKDITSVFEAAYQNNRELALRTLLWVRDVRGGAGERQTFRSLLRFLESNHHKDAKLIAEHVAEYGRWDDLLIFETKEFKLIAANLIHDALTAGNGLCAKWMPRKGKIAMELRKFMDMSPKQWRKTLVGFSKDVVEVKMCAKDWSGINFSHVPSVAAARYRKAFYKNDETRYTAYVDSLTKKDGSVKVNANAIFPHDVLKNAMNQYGYGGSTLTRVDHEFIVAQWEALPNLMGDDAMLPMVDVSGSMTSQVSNNLSAMEIAISLGLYIADKQDGPFKDLVLSFTKTPKIQNLQGDVISKIHQLRSDVGYNTNVQAAFAEILRYAKAQNIAHADMPKKLVILSDMEFDQINYEYGSGHGGVDKTIFDNATEQFNQAGYERPDIVFWNLNGREGNAPVTFDQNGTALISGYSQNVLKGIMAGAEDMSPESIMLQTLMVERYDVIAA